MNGGQTDMSQPPPPPPPAEGVHYGPHSYAEGPQMYSNDEVQAHIAHTESQFFPSVANNTNTSSAQQTALRVPGLNMPHPAHVGPSIYPVQKYGFFSFNPVKQLPFQTSKNEVPDALKAAAAEHKKTFDAMRDPTLIAANDDIPMMGGFPTVKIPGAEQRDMGDRGVAVLSMEPTDTELRLFGRLITKKIEKIRSKKRTYELQERIMALVNEVLLEQGDEPEPLEGEKTTEEQVDGPMEGAMNDSASEPDNKRHKVSE